MHKCDSCGKVVVNEQDYMCPHCGAVSNKHCDHSTHLPDDKYFRANDYRTAAEEHKSKTYDYEKAPKTDASQKFDINDLANIKGAEDIKKIAKKAFIEQDKNGKKKFKPIAIVLIVIFAINIFANLMSVAFDAVDSVFEEIAGELPDEWVGYELGEETLTHNFNVDIVLKNAMYDAKNDCLKFNLSEAFFNHFDTINEDYETVTENWQSEFTSPKECFFSNKAEVSIAVFSKEDIKDTEKVENAYWRAITLYGEVSPDGTLCIYGINQHMKELTGQKVYLDILSVTILAEVPETREKFEMWLGYPFNFVGINPNGEVEFLNVSSFDGVVSTTEFDLKDQYYSDDDYYDGDECVEHIDFSENNVDESVPASVTYTETVDLVD